MDLGRRKFETVVMVVEELPPPHRIVAVPHKLPNRTIAEAEDSPIELARQDSLSKKDKIPSSEDPEAHFSKGDALSLSEATGHCAYGTDRV